MKDDWRGRERTKSRTVRRRDGEDKAMKNLAIVSYNIHCNFTNYGSALHSLVLRRLIGQLQVK